MRIKKLLGEKIKRIRKSRGFTQEQLAELIDITPRNMSRIEVGDSFVSAETLENILEALNVSADVLFSYNHIKDEKELIAEIYSYIDFLRKDRKLLEKAHKMLRFLVEDEK